MLVTTLIRKLLRLKAHNVTQLELEESQVVVTINQLGQRLLQCGVCGGRCRKLHGRPRAERSWRDLSLRNRKMILRYQPRRVNCPRCGVRVERFPWAEAWARVTRSLARAVAVLARQLSGLETAATIS